MGDQPGIESPTSFGGPREEYIPRRVILAEISGSSGDGGVAQFRVETPDSRVRVRISVVGVPRAGGQPNFMFGLGATLWLAALEDDQTSTSGIAIPVINTIPGVTRASPLAIPQDAGLGGYSRELVTAADAILGELTIPPIVGDGFVGTIALQCRYQPDGQRLPWEEWDEIRRECGGALLGPKIKT
jgi:hypothetical protein